MKNGAAAGVLVAALGAALLGGCAGGPRPATVGGPAAAPARSSAADSIVEQVLTRIELASLQSLTEAARLLSTPDATGTTKTPRLVQLGSYVFHGLYPELENPFPGEPPASADAVGDIFLAHCLPAFVLLGPDGEAADTEAPGLGALLAAAVEENTHSVLAPYLMARLLELQREPKEARRLYEQMLALSPSFYPAAARLIPMIIAGGTAAADLPRLEALAGQLPSAPQRFGALARIYLAAGQPAKAADAAARGLLAAPDDPQFVILRAKAFEDEGDWYRSLRLLETLLKVAPDEKAAILAKARLLHEKARNSGEALQVLADAEQRFPEDADFPELNAHILIDTGHADDAVKLLTQALSLAPNRLSVLTELLRQAVLGERWAQASSWLAEIPAGAWTAEHYELGWKVATAQAEHEKALSLARALEKIAAGPRASALEARSLAAVGTPEQALVVVDDALRTMDPDPAMKAELLVVRASAGSTDPLHDLRAALLSDPHSVAALVALSDVMAKAHDYRKAVEYAKQAAALSPGNTALAQKVIDLAKRTESRQ
jgi:tetratricopeptide (TPR) repeat protein